MVTLAPNRVGAESIAELARRGVLVSLGHSEASYEEARAAIQAGARAFTHLFNAMSASVGREPGMVGAALDLDDAFVGIIADGHHVHEANLRIALACEAARPLHADFRRDAACGRRARPLRSAGTPRNPCQGLPAARRWNARGARF